MQIAIVKAWKDQNETKRIQLNGVNGIHHTRGLQDEEKIEIKYNVSCLQVRQ